MLKSPATPSSRVMTAQGNRNTVSTSEHQEQDGKQIVTYPELHPRFTAGRDTTLVRLHLLCIVRTGCYRIGERDDDTHESDCRQ